jgi:hypothetical protein
MWILNLFSSDVYEKKVSLGYFLGHIFFNEVFIHSYNLNLHYKSFQILKVVQPSKIKLDTLHILKIDYIVSLGLYVSMRNTSKYSII